MLFCAGKNSFNRLFSFFVNGFVLRHIAVMFCLRHVICPDMTNNDFLKTFTLCALLPQSHKKTALHEQFFL